MVRDSPISENPENENRNSFGIKLGGVLKRDS